MINVFLTMSMLKHVFLWVKFIVLWVKDLYAFYLEYMLLVSEMYENDISFDTWVEKE